MLRLLYLLMSLFGTPSIPPDPDYGGGYDPNGEDENELLTSLGFRERGRAARLQERSAACRRHGPVQGHTPRLAPCRLRRLPVPHREPLAGPHTAGAPRGAPSDPPRIRRLRARGHTSAFLDALLAAVRACRGLLCSWHRESRYQSALAFQDFARWQCPDRPLPDLLRED
jgi:hypothetical protein